MASAFRGSKRGEPPVSSVAQRHLKAKLGGTVCAAEPSDTRSLLRRIHCEEKQDQLFPFWIKDLLENNGKTNKQIARASIMAVAGRVRKIAKLP